MVPKTHHPLSMVYLMQQQKDNDSFFSQIQEKLTPRTLGILWLTNKPIIEREVPFDELNYFFDGTLGKNVFQSEKPLNPNLVISTHYGYPTHLGQVELNSSQLGQTLNKILKIMQNQTNGRKQVLVITKDQKLLPSSVKKSNPSIEFDFLIF